MMKTEISAKNPLFLRSYVELKICDQPLKGLVLLREVLHIGPSEGAVFFGIGKNHVFFNDKKVDDMKKSSKTLNFREFHTHIPGIQWGLS